MARNEEIRELFIEELEEVSGGANPVPKDLVQWIRDQFQTTYACGEEGPDTC